MRLAVQQLIAGIPLVHRVSYAIECGAEEFAVGTGKLWSLRWVVNLRCPSGHSIGDVRCRQIDLAQAGMDSEECVRIVSRRDSSHLLVVGPERESEALTHVNAGLRARLKHTNRALGFGETASNVCFELEAVFPPLQCDPGEDVTRHEAHGYAVGVVNDDRVVDVEAELPGRHLCGRNRAPDLGWFHARLLRTSGTFSSRWPVYRLPETLP
jgi:hypothetical protein